MPRSISFAQLNQIMSTNPCIIDTREPYEFARHHLPTAINIPYQTLTMYPERYLIPGRTYYLICEHGGVSYRAASILEAYGYHAISISRGYEAEGFRY